MTRDDLRFYAIMAANITELQDIWGLCEDSRIAALLIPDLVALALALTTRYNSGLHCGKFARWCDSNTICGDNLNILHVVVSIIKHPTGTSEAIHLSWLDQVFGEPSTDKVLRMHRSVNVFGRY